MRYLIAVSILVAVLLAGCGGSSSGPSGPTDYYPLAVGNWWIMDLDGYVLWGADTVTVTAVNENTVTRTTTHAQGFDLYEIEQISTMTFTHPDTTFSDTDTTFTYIAESDSEVVAYDDTITLDHEVMLKLPVTVGETWNPYSDEPDIVREILSITVSVSVPAGSFSGCLHMEDRDPQAPDDEFEAWAAPSVGPVRMLIDSSGVFHVEGELRSYVANN
jgi:hypothetical protein